MQFDVGTSVSMQELATICGGVYRKGINADVTFDHISVDSKETGKGTLFVALKGERTDGHKYIPDAMVNGSNCFLCERIPEGVSDSYSAVVVPDTKLAIGQMAMEYDRRFSHRKVAVTGSVGKTTTKEFISGCLSHAFKVHKTPANFNSDIGMPLAMLSMNRDTEVSVLEMGMNHFGEIDYLSRIANPDIAVITNIGSSHIGILGSRENIFKAKMEIVNGLKSDGTLVLNGDDDLLSTVTEAQGKRIVRVGMQNPDCEYFAENIRSCEFGVWFDLRVNGRVIKDIAIGMPGVHNVYAALFAFAVGDLLGMKEEDIIEGVACVKLPEMRQKIAVIGGIRVVEDCYNAAPESVNAALKLTREVATTGRVCALLGNMNELGEYAEECHRKVGKDVAELGVDVLFTLGDNAEYIAEEAVKYGMNPDNVYRNADYTDPQTSLEQILGTLRTGDTLLIKASRGVHAENVLKLLEKAFVTL